MNSLSSHAHAPPTADPCPPARLSLPKRGLPSHARRHTRAARASRKTPASPTPTSTHTSTARPRPTSTRGIRSSYPVPRHQRTLDSEEARTLRRGGTASLTQRRSTPSPRPALAVACPEPSRRVPPQGHVWPVLFATMPSLTSYTRLKKPMNLRSTLDSRCLARTPRRRGSLDDRGRGHGLTCVSPPNRS